MLIIGLTGGIGSGKTAVSDRFEELGITVVDADLASRAVVEVGRPALAQIEEHFGSDVIQADGTLDRAELRKKVFADEGERKWLEALLHPLIGEEVFNGLGAATSAYAVFVSPLLFETGQNVMCDRILTVDVSEEKQLERTMSRDSNSEEQVKAIMAAQAARQDRLDKTDDVISNDGTLEELYTKIQAMHETYLTKAKEKDAAGN